MSISMVAAPARVRMKRSVYVIEHMQTGQYLRMTSPDAADAVRPPTLRPLAAATWFFCRAFAEDALAELGPAPLEIVRVDA